MNHGSGFARETQDLHAKSYNPTRCREELRAELGEVSKGIMAIGVRIERKHSDLPAFVTIPADRLATLKLTGTTTVEATIDGVDLGRRSLQRLDETRWFLEIRKEHLESLGKTIGSTARLTISLASTALPDELQHLIDTVPAASARWKARTDAQKRMLREHVLEAKKSETRARRARRALLPPPKPAPPRVEGLSSDPRAIAVRIIGRSLPGRACGPYRDVRVGFAQMVGCDPEEWISGDEYQATWETRIEVWERDGAAAFKGKAVNGPPRERFFYLVWIGRQGNERASMFRRAKLRLDAVPPDVLAASVVSGKLVGRLGLTAEDGLPVCASIRPPMIVWTSS